MIIFNLQQLKYNLMHNYDPPHKYGLTTRMGNWSEEWDLEETKRKQYIRRKHQGISNVSLKQQQLLKSMQAASLTYSHSSFRKFGDHVMAFNGKVQSFLVTDVCTQQNATEESYQVSAIKHIHAAARSVFVLERSNLNDGYKDNIIHYGQQLRIRINPLLIDKPIYLYSQPSSVNRYSKVSRLQEVIFSLKSNYNTVWIFEHPDPNLRLEMTGSPIKTDDTVLIKHEMTNQWLAADQKLYENAFGKEYEVMAHNFLVNNKTQNLIQQKRGKLTIDTPARSQKDENLWLLLGASSKDQEFDESQIKNQVVNKQTLYKKLKHLLTERGVYGIRFLHKIFKCLDTERVGVLDENDFRWGLQSGKIFLTEDELAFLIKTYQQKQLVSYRDFLHQIRGNLNQNRYKSIVEAYQRVKKVAGPKVTVESLGKIYDAKKHPEVVTLKKSEKEAFNEFIWSWDNIKPDYLIELQEFAAYFEDLSAMIPRDDHFEYLLLSVLHL